MEYEWNRRVVNYDEEVQTDFLSSILGEATEQKAVMLLAGLAILVIAAVSLTIVKIEPRNPRPAVERLYAQVGRELEKIKLGRKRGEAPLHYRDRVVAARPELAELMAELTQCYMDVNYRSALISEGDRKQQLAQLKMALTQIRMKLLPMMKLRRLR